MAGFVWLSRRVRHRPGGAIPDSVQRVADCGRGDGFTASMPGIAVARTGEEDLTKIANDCPPRYLIEG